jgi:transmembrane sensor
MRSWDWRDSIDGLRKRTEVHVDEAWQARIVDGIHGRQRRRFLRPALALSLAGLAFAVWGLHPWHRPASPIGTMSTRAPMETLQFDADATGTRMSPDAEAVVVEQNPARTRVDLRRGSVHFDIGHTGRAFQVQAAGVTVTVLGTSFTVTRQRAEVTVAVKRGRVRVQSGNDMFELSGGEQRSVNVEGMAAEPSEAEPPNSQSASESTTIVPTVSPAITSKRPLRATARAVGDSASGHVQRDDVEMLMRAADESRQAQDWSAALADYGRVVAQHGHDSRAGLASFSMGRILLHQLHRPGQAARAFADARRLPLSPGLAREALGREIEAWHAASDDVQARGLAQEYVRRYSEAAAPAVVRELIHKP